jgi:ArsR family transcriptional regulator
MPVTTKSTASAFRRRASFDKMLDPGLLRALAEPNRTSLLSCLLKCGRPCSVSEIAACCDLDFSVVSRHLQSLARCGLVVAAKRGRTVWYSAAGDVLSAYLRRLADAVDELTASERAGAGCCPPGACAAPNLTKRTTSPAGCR